MTQFVTTLAQTLHIGSAFDVITSAIKGLYKRVEITKKVNSTIKELNQLSDKELADIGITRGMIRSIAMEAYDAHRN